MNAPVNDQKASLTVLFSIGQYDRAWELDEFHGHPFLFDTLASFEKSLMSQSSLPQYSTTRDDHVIFLR
jgi:hypothetical protein